MICSKWGVYITLLSLRLRDLCRTCGNFIRIRDVAYDFQETAFSSHNRENAHMNAQKI